MTAPMMAAVAHTRCRRVKEHRETVCRDEARQEAQDVVAAMERATRRTRASQTSRRLAEIAHTATPADATSIATYTRRPTPPWKS